MLQEIINRMAKESENLDEDSIMGLGFNPIVSLETQQILMSNGWWHTVYFASDEYYQYGLRILPNKKWTDWPVVMTLEHARSVTFAPNIQCFIPFIKLEQIKYYPPFVHDLSTEWDSFYEMMKPISAIVGGEAGIQFLHKFIRENAKCDKDTLKKQHEAYYTFFWNSLGNSQGNTALRKLISEMLADEKYYPEMPGNDLDIWETRIKNLVAMRICIEGGKDLAANRQLDIWSALCEPAGYDAQDVIFSQYPDYSFEPYICISRLAMFLDKNIIPINENIMNDPLYNALKALLKKGKKQYNGLDHFKAFETLESEMNDPLRSWKALVSASYWSGITDRKLTVETLQAAINLCKNQDWKDAHEALTYQLSASKGS